MHSSFPFSSLFRIRACLFLLAALLLMSAGICKADPPESPEGTTPSVVQDALQAVAEQATSEMPAVQTASALPAVPGEAVPAAKADTEVPLELSWLLDDKGKRALGDVLAESAQKTFRPYEPESLPHQAGSIWLRLEPQGKTPTFPLVLDLNTRIAGQLPGIPQVWLARSGETTGTPVRPTGEGLYHLPSPLPDQTNIYIRVSGIPAPGFMPLLRDVSSLTVIDELGAQPQLVLLAMLLFVCLLRGIAERREWRMWAALYIAAVWVQAFWGLPTTPAGEVSRWDMPGLLAPGVALLILPHVGRHMMRTRLLAPFIDMQFVLLALCGIALSVAPLIPGYTWTLQFLPLWPLFTLLLLPTTLAACVRRLPGAKRFFLLCLFPPLGMLALFPLNRLLPDSLIAMLPHELDGFMTPGVISLIPLTCLALSALVAALSPSPKLLSVPKRTNRESTKTGKAGVAALELGGFPKVEAAQQLPLSVDPTQLDTSFTPPTAADRAQTAPTPADVPASGVYPQSLQTPLAAGMVEDTLRTPLDALLRAISAVDQASLPAEARRRTDALSLAGRNLAKAVSGLNRPQTPARAPETRERFDLNQLLLDIHETVSGLAESKNIGLSWFTAPHLPRSYEGCRTQLAGVLSLLVESAVLATERGMVQIRAQRLPESTDPGHLLFTVSDTGSGLPPFGRSTLALVRAWELVGPDGELVSLESGPKGTTISFSMRLTARSVEQPAPSTPQPDTEALSRLPASSLRIIVASGVPANRQLLSFYLDELPHEILEARTPEEAMEMYRRTPGALIIFDDDMPEEAIAGAVAAIRSLEGEHNFPLACILALVNSDEQIDMLRRAGCTHFLKKPITRKGLRHLTLRLAPVSRRFKDAETTEDMPEKNKVTTKAPQPVSSDIPDLPELPETKTEPAAAPAHKNPFASLFSAFRKKAPAQAPAAASMPLEQPSVLLPETPIPPLAPAQPVPAQPTSSQQAAPVLPAPEPAPEPATAHEPAQLKTVVEPEFPAAFVEPEVKNLAQTMPSSLSEPLSAPLPETPLDPLPDLLPEVPTSPRTESAPQPEAVPSVAPTTPPHPEVPEAPHAPEALPTLEAPAPRAVEASETANEPEAYEKPKSSEIVLESSTDPSSEALSASSPSEEDTILTLTDLEEPVTMLTERIQLSSVGDPTPIPRQQDAPVPRRPRPERPNPLEERAKRTPARSSAPEHATEWVGEPIPIVKKGGLPDLTPPKLPPNLAEEPDNRKALRTSRQPDEPLTLTPERAPQPLLPDTTIAEVIREPRVLDGDALLLDSPIQEAPLPDLFGTPAQTGSLLDEAARLAPCTQGSRPNPVADPLTIEDIVELGAPLDTAQEATTPPSAPQGSERERSDARSLSEEKLQTAADNTPVSGQEEASDEAIHLMLDELDAALERALYGAQTGDAQTVCAAAAHIGKLAETYDLRMLDDPARCLEEAARAGKTDEIAQLVPDLVAAITRNRAAFTGEES